MLGIGIIALGVLILMGKLGLVQFVASHFWPVFILIPGLLFHALFFYRVLPSGVLIPGAILTVISLMFFYCNFAGWDSMAWLWPGFILAVALGLYEYYLFDLHKPKGALIAAAILAIAGAVFFVITLMHGAALYIVALALIAAGIYTLARRPNAW